MRGVHDYLSGVYSRSMLNKMINFGQILWFMLLFPLPFFLLVVVLFIKPQRRLHQKITPPSPKRLPFLGNLHQLVGDLPHMSLQRLSNEYGPLMLLQLGSVPTLIISSADVAREIFKTHDLIFSNRSQPHVAKKLSYEGNNISFAPYGEYWRQVRKISFVELLSTKRIQSFHFVRNEEINLMIDSITCSQARPVNLSNLSLALANNIICRVAFSKKHDTGGEAKFSEILKETQSLLGEFNVADFYPWLGWLLNKVNGLDARLEKNFKQLDGFYDQVIKEHIDQTRSRTLDHEDLVDVLLRLQKDPKSTIALSNIKVKGILTDIFVAGTDTSAATLVWAMSELIKNPSTMKRAQDEVRQVANGKQRVDETDLPKLTYLKMVLKETLRLHPPLPLLVPRETTQRCTVGGYEIPAKTRVFINAKAIAMDSNIWGNSSNKFEPERFFDSSIDYKGQDYELIPFGVGRRVCPGLNFAVLAVELTLANLLRCFDWSLPDEMTSDDIDMLEAPGLATHKKNPLVLVATPFPCNH